MTVASAILDILGLVGIGIGYLCLRRHRKWERQLRGARIAVAYKGKVKINAPLSDWLLWAQSLDADKTVTGRTVYKLGMTTVAILKPRSPEHGKATTKTVKEAA